MVREFAEPGSACHNFYVDLQKCYTEHPIRRFMGYCSPFYKELQKCINLQQKKRQELSAERSKRMYNKSRERHSQSE